MMADYKSAKEAFHADNPGSSVHYINLVSITALTGYGLYATMSRRLCGLGVDYATTILPLLMSMTTLSSRLIALNVTVALLAWVFGMTTPRRWYPKRVTKPRGRWLAESDSEDEGSGGRSTPTRKPKVKLPSQALAEANAAELERRTSGSTSALASPISGDEGDARRRRRHSPSGPAAVIDIGASPPTTPNPRRSTSVKREKLPQPDPPANTHLPHSRAGRPVRPRTHLPFLSVYRAHMMVMTVLAILAVDFPVFPRVLGKTEDWGTGLMDVGVGSFVFSLGIVSSKAFATTRKGKMLRTLAGALRRAVPVLALGFVRLLMVKGVEYPEHITEYGVHWNFFFTLGLVPALATALLPLRRQFKWGATALGLCILHQLVLSLPGLTPFLLNNYRPNILAANKEGLASLPGYLALFLVGLSCGEHILALSTGRRRRSSPRHRVSATSGNESDDEFSDPDIAAERATGRRSELALELAGYAAASWIALAACQYVGFRVSRRLANAPYVLWCVAYNTSYLAGYLAIEIWLFDPSPGHSESACPPLLDAINANGLVVFLLANLGTGLVNVSMQTMFAPDWLAMAVLVTYSIVIVGIAWKLRSVRIKI